MTHVTAVERERSTETLLQLPEKEAEVCREFEAAYWRASSEEPAVQLSVDSPLQCTVWFTEYSGGCTWPV